MQDLGKTHDGAYVDRLFRRIIEDASTWESIVLFEGPVVWTNGSVEHVTGFAVAECQGMANYPRPIADPTDAGNWEYMFIEAQAGRSCTNSMMQIRHKDGRRIPVNVSWSPVRGDGGDVIGVHFSVSPLVSTTRIEESLRTILHEVARAAGAKFFEQLSISMQKSTGADFVLVGRYRPGIRSVTTLAVCAGGAIMPNFTYELEGTPCSSVLGQDACVFPRNVAKLFPDDVMLADMGIEGYIGRALYDSENRPCGIIIALYKTVIEDFDFVRTLFQLFATRVAAEIDRSEAEESLKDLNANLDQLVRERTRELEAAQQQLVRVARQIGMAEVATNVLHNVGNVLTSINVSLDAAKRAIADLPLASVGNVATMLNDNQQHLADFLTRDDKGRMLPRFVTMLADRLDRGREQINGELEQTTAHLAHVHEIVRLQQSHAGLSHLVEVCNVAEVLEAAVRICVSPSDEALVELNREYESLPPMLLDRHKAQLILINLVTNARHAVAEMRGAPRKINLRIRRTSPEWIAIEVSDTGVGIAAENMTRIFQSGFTTRKTGHGFGLHASALAAKELNGRLGARSDGSGLGATFTLELPFTPASNDACGSI